jgi:hypothetical protein
MASGEREARRAGRIETHPDKPVPIVNPMSGGGTASRHDLLGQCRARGIDRGVLGVTQHLETTGRHLEAIAPDVDVEPSALDAIAD